MAFVNQFGRIDDDRQKAFEKSMCRDVWEHLNSLIAKGVSLVDVRLAVLQLIGSIHMTEADVILRQQAKARRARNFPAMAARVDA